MLQPVKFIGYRTTVLNQSYGKACPIIDRLTRPILPSGVPNGEDGRLCAADGWVDEGREHVTGTLSKVSG